MKNGKEFQCGILMIATLVLCLTSPAVASKRTVGLLLNERGGLAGYTLFTPRWNSTVCLIDHFVGNPSPFRESLTYRRTKCP